MPLVLLAGCSFLFGEDGLFPDNSEQYKGAPELAKITVPSRLEGAKSEPDCIDDIARVCHHRQKRLVQTVRIQVVLIIKNPYPLPFENTQYIEQSCDLMVIWGHSTRKIGKQHFIAEP